MRFEKLGPIVSGEIEFSNLTILCGGNNQGKTYVSYTFYGIIENFPDLILGFFNNHEIEELKENGTLQYEKNEYIRRLSSHIHKKFKDKKNNILDDVFKSNNSNFNDTEIKFSNNEITKLLFLSTNMEVDANIGKEHKIKYTVDDNEVSILLMGDFKELNFSPKNYSFMLDTVLIKSIEKIVGSFYIPAERIGLNVFRSQLNDNKIETMDALSSIMHLEKRNKNPGVLNNFLKIFSETTTSFPKPINDYLKYINDINTYDSDDKNGSEIAVFIRENILKGKFTIDESDNTSYFRSKYGTTKYKKEAIPLHITSSSIKSIYGLDYFFEHLDKEKNYYLIIDEPEMNLHPSNQVEFANVLDMAVKHGLHVIISTHSDLLVKKVQNIILKNELDSVSNLDGLTKSNVNIYDFKDGAIHKVDIFNDNLVFENFNSTINSLEEEYLDLLDMKAIQNKELY